MRAMGTTPRTVTGTAVAKPNDPESQLAGIETARARLERAALTMGVFIGEPKLETIYADGADGGYQVIVLTAPVLDTGSDEKVDTAITYLDPTLEDLDMRDDR
jgi:hypothetical protein